MTYHFSNTRRYLIGLIALIAGTASHSEGAVMGSVLFLFISFIYFAIYGLVTLIPNWALFIRRFHDTGRSMVLPLSYLGVSIITYIILLIIGFQDLESTNIVNVIIIVLIYVFYIGFGIYFLVIACLDSERKTNKYGPSHKYANQYTKIDKTYKEQ